MLDGDPELSLASDAEVHLREAAGAQNSLLAEPVCNQGRVEQWPRANFMNQKLRGIPPGGILLF